MRGGTLFLLVIIIILEKLHKMPKIRGDLYDNPLFLKYNYNILLITWFLPNGLSVL